MYQCIVDTHISLGELQMWFGKNVCIIINWTLTTQKIIPFLICIN